MNDENKNQNLSGEGENEEQKLNEELETLRDTFQEKYDESVEEANAAPVIQELEEGEEEEEPEDEENEDTAVPVAEKAPKKKRKTGKIIAIAIPVILVVLVVGSLLAYVVSSMTNPNFSSFISAYAQATSAEKYEDKITYLEQALKYCSDEDSVFQNAMATTILEEIVVAKYNEEGFTAAFSYMNSNMSAQQISNPVTSEFKKIIKITDEIKKLSLEAYDKVFENLGDSETVPEADVLSQGLSVPADVKDNVNELLKAIAEGYIGSKTAEGLEDSLVAMNYYANAYSGFLSLGADSRALAEKISVTLYNKGLVVEAAAFASVAIDPTQENVNADYTKFREYLSAYENLNISVLTLAQEALDNEKTDSESILALVKDSAEISDENAKTVASFVEYAIKGINSEKEHNLTKASSNYATLASVLDAFGMTDVSVHLKTAKTIFDCGNLPDAKTIVETYLTDEAMEAATAEDKAIRDNMIEVFDALTAASDVFSPYYSEYYQYGTPMNYEEVSAALNELITEDSSDYEKGFVNYCLYFAAVASEDNVQTKPLIDAMASYMPDLPFVFGYYYIDEYVIDKNYKAAANYAKKLLEINVADEYANSVIALSERINGNLDASIEAALKGVELSGSSTDCGKQLAISYMLKGEYESAFGYLLTLYTNNMSVDSCDLLLVFNALYEGDDADIKAELEAAVSEINQTYSYYGVTSYEDTTAILNGEKTLEDVFMAGNYDLSDDN
ncbi:MAG: hypothetical protein IKL10_11220 [Clostridia bacterium]|nr:hypothetical protein [Clostridia bacterium]